METKENKFNWMKNSISFKITVIGFLILILLIPANMVKNLVLERQLRMREVQNEISQKWGGNQTIAGPVITVPCVYQPDKKEDKPVTYYITILPDKLDITGKLIPEKRHRGIFDVIVYKSDIEIKSKFNISDFDELYKGYSIKWHRAILVTGVTDTRGIQQNIMYNINGKQTETQPGTSFCSQFNSGVNARVDLSQKKEFDVTCKLNVNGSGLFSVLPLGHETTFYIESDWAHPQFDGSFLPDSEFVSDTGFTARWKVLQHNRNYPQHWLSTRNISNSEMGVELIEEVDIYQKSTRAVKYAVLFILLTFLVFFFTEVIIRKRAHPVQYLMTGAALVVFFSLLIALSEHIHFNLAYMVAASTIILMITFFTQGIFKERKVTITVFGVLAILFIFLFTILQVADYSLIMGNIGLVIILAVIMFISRKVDWFHEKETMNE